MANGEKLAPRKKVHRQVEKPTAQRQDKTRGAPTTVECKAAEDYAAAYEFSCKSTFLHFKVNAPEVRRRALSCHL
jgi:hypothetical protein